MGDGGEGAIGQAKRTIGIAQISSGGTRSPRPLGENLRRSPAEPVAELGRELPEMEEAPLQGDIGDGDGAGGGVGENSVDAVEPLRTQPSAGREADIALEAALEAAQAQAAMPRDLAETARRSRM